MPHIENLKVYKDDGETAPLWIDGLLEKNLNVIKDKIKQDWDFVFVVDGIEGCGKSVFAQQAALYCDPTLDITRICFSPEDFKKAIIEAEKYQAVVYDEAYAGLNSRQTMTQTNRAIVSMLAEIRQKNLFVFIVLPTFFDLDKNVALWRSRGLFHIHLGKNFERGYWKFYNQTTKKYLYLKGKKLYDYTAKSAMPNLKGKFLKGYVVDEKEYRNQKKASLKKYSEEEELDKLLIDYKKNLVNNLYDVKDKLGLTNKHLGMILGITDRTILRYKKRKLEEIEELSKHKDGKPLEKPENVTDSATSISLTSSEGGERRGEAEESEVET